MQIEWIIDRCNEVLFGYVKEQDPLSSLNIKELNENLTEAARHGMLPVVMESLSRAKILDPEKKKIVLKKYGASEKFIKKYWQRLDLMEQMALQFKKAGLDVMFIKGATLSLRYPSVELRYFGDLDFYLFGRAREGAEALAENGIAGRE